MSRRHLIRSGWKPTHLTSKFSLQTSVTSPHGTTVMAFADVKYVCLQMLDRLVSTNPSVRLWPYSKIWPRWKFLGRHKHSSLFVQNFRNDGIKLSNVYTRLARNRPWPSCTTCRSRRWWGWRMPPEPDLPKPSMGQDRSSSQVSVVLWNSRLP